MVMVVVVVVVVLVVVIVWYSIDAISLLLQPAAE